MYSFMSGYKQCIYKLCIQVDICLTTHEEKYEKTLNLFIYFSYLFIWFLIYFLCICRGPQ